MTPKQTALAAVARLVGVSMGYALSFALLVYLLPPVVLGAVAAAGVAFYLLKLLYELELDKAEQSAKLVDKPLE